KKLAMRPVMSTASGGKKKQKKNRRGFIARASSSCESSSSSPFCFLIFLLSIFYLSSPLSTANTYKNSADAIQARHSYLRSRFPCICQFAHSALPAFPGGALRHAPRFPADPALRLLA